MQSPLKFQVVFVPAQDCLISDQFCAAADVKCGLAQSVGWLAPCGWALKVTEGRRSTVVVRSPKHAMSI